MACGLSRAVTPPGRVRRFDTAFLCVGADQIAHRAAIDVGPDDELVELDWISLTATSAYPLPAITRVVLHDLAMRLDRGVESDAPVPFYRQVRGRWLRDAI